MLMLAFSWSMAQDNGSASGTTKDDTVTEERDLLATDAHWLQGSGDDVYRDSGNVAVGTSGLPKGKLHVEAGDDHGLIINTDDQSPWAIRIRNLTATTKGLEVYQDDDGKVLFANNYPNGTEMWMTADGLVGIGTSNPKTALQVNGAIRVFPQAGATCDSSTKGSIYFDSSTGHFYGCDGSLWVQLDASGAGSSSSFITSDTTLEVPGSFANIQTAMAYLNDKTFNADVTVNIQVDDGTYTSYDPINFHHPQGNQIKILGNTSNASACELQFDGTGNGITIANGNVLGEMNGFTLTGSNDTFVGILVTGRSQANLGNEMVVQDWEMGAYVNFSGHLLADYLETKSNGEHGLVCDLSSTVRANYLNSNNNGGHGVSVSLGSSAVLDNATLSSNSNYGIHLLYNGTAYVRSATYTNNSSGTYLLENGGQIWD